MQVTFTNGETRNIYAVSIEVFYWNDASDTGKRISYSVEGHYQEHCCSDIGVIRVFDSVNDAIAFHACLENQLEEERLEKRKMFQRLHDGALNG